MPIKISLLEDIDLLLSRLFACVIGILNVPVPEPGPGALSFPLLWPYLRVAPFRA